MVRSTHGVNCTGSCSWKVYVKDGVITWESQQTDYPTVGPDSPEYEPRGCPRGAAFSWYTYSPTRIRYPYVRSVLLGADVPAGQDPAPGPGRRLGRGRRSEDPHGISAGARQGGGLVRSSWPEVNEDDRRGPRAHGQSPRPDRIFGFSPIPAMSMAHTPPAVVSSASWAGRC